MESRISNNKKIAINTMFLYIRTLIVLGISLFTSRVVLQVLGAEDLGIYNVVGGIVALMGFFQTAQTKATSRFITYELGKHSNNYILQKVFSVCMTIHIIIAFVSLIFGETIGLWMIINWTDIPIARQDAAMWVYQFALVVFCCQIVRVPYDAIIVAHERMSMYAYMSILEAILLLGMAYLLMIAPGDSLIYYSASGVVIAFILFLCYYFYVHRFFSAYRYRPVWDKEYSMRVLSFSGWTLLGSSANTITQQGTSLLMNNFVGLIANAALGFAGQVNIAVSKFVNGFSTAFTPQIIKLYAQDDYNSMHTLMNRSSKFSFVLCYLMALPLIANMGFILSLWLGSDVPMYTKEFCQLILVCTIFDATTGVYNTTITATGRIQYYQIAISLSFLLDLACCYVLLVCSVSPIFVYGSRIMTRGVINMFIGLYFIKSYTHFDVLNYSKTVLLSIIITIIITTLPVYYITQVTDGWACLISTFFVSVFLITICTLYIIMTRSERKTVLSKLMHKLN